MAILAERAEQAAPAGARPAGPLESAILAVKDMIAVRGRPRGAGSRSQEGAAPCTEDAPAVAALLGAGAVLTGLTALHELAFGVTGINAYAGTPENPAARGRVPGGSSSGSAVAVATGTADIALGTDTGGSVRIPAALCGVVGYKPPFGLLPTVGVLPLADSLDHVGVLARSVALARAVHRVFDPGGPVPDDDGAGRLALGIDLTRLAECEPGIAGAFRRTVEGLASLHSIVEVRLPATDEVVAVTNAIMFHEAATHYGDLARDAASGLGDDVRARLVQGLEIGEPDYVAALGRGRELTAAMTGIVGSVDAVLEPTVPIGAPTLADAPALGPRLVAHTRLANLTGLPAISLPLPAPGLPVGLQLTARDARTLFAVAMAAEAIVAGR